MSSTAIYRRGPTLAAILLACSTAAFAADASLEKAASTDNAMTTRQAAIASAQTLGAPARSVKAQTGTATAGTTQPGEIFANPFRAYPPSCLGDGLPFRSFPQSSGDPPVQQQVLNLPGDPAQCLGGGNTAECIYTEPVTVTAWRVACDGNKTAVLVEIDRDAMYEGNVTKYPTFPAVSIQQNGNTLYPARLVDDPNTFYANTLVNTAFYSSDIFVLENHYNSNVAQIDYTKAFVLTLDNATFSFPDYDHTKYAASNLALPISGYLSTNWYDPAHNGEGMLTQIYDSGDHATRIFTAAWYTFDKLGLPFWLYAQGTINIGDRAANNVATYYATNGGFAGGFGNATFTPWGTVNVSFTDCNTMKFSFNGQTDAQTNGPSGSGSRSWTRLASINSLSCD